MSIPLHVLIIGDSAQDTDLLLGELRRGGYGRLYERVDTRDALNEAISLLAWDVVLSDYSMPRFSARAALAVLTKANLDIPFIIVSASIGEEIAADAVRSGARGYIRKDNLHRLLLRSRES